MELKRYYRYDGTSNHILFESNTSGGIVKAYTNDTDGHPLTMRYNGNTYYYLTNYRGDVLALTNASGTVVAQYTYDAWGNIKHQSGSMATINPYRYAGYRYDEETKLYYLMACYYNPETAVFLSLDPVRGDLRNPLTMNGYNYVSNNPVMMVDSDGNWAVTALYFVPGYGQIAVVATGIILIGYYGAIATYKTGSLIAEKIKSSKDKTYILSTPTNNPDGFIKLRNGQGYKEKSIGDIWNKDKLHKDHWDISDKKGKKVKEVDFNGNQIWPNGSKNKK